MKKSTFSYRLSRAVVGLLSGLVLLSCGTDATKEQTNTGQSSKICTVVFMDKSLSVNINRAFVNDKYQKIISNVVNENIRQKGDRLEVYFIHENTSKAKAMEVECQSEMEDVSNASPTDKEAMRASFDLFLQKERAAFRQRAIAQLAVTNTSASNQETDIWASLAVIDRLVSEGYDVKAYYLSDMIESVRGAGRRDFHTTPPRNDTQAEEWAKADAETLKSKYPNVAVAQISLALPFEPTSTVQQNNPAVTKYWEVLFGELGVINPVKELY